MGWSKYLENLNKEAPKSLASSEKATVIPPVNGAEIYGDYDDENTRYLNHLIAAQLTEMQCNS